MIVQNVLCQNPIGMSKEPSAPGAGFTGSVDGAAPHDPLGNLMRLPHDAQGKLLHPKKRYFTDSNHYDTR